MSATAINALVRNGRIEVDVPNEWPEGTEVAIAPVQHTNGLGFIVGMTEEEQGDDPESIARWIAEFEAIPPLVMSAHEEADMLAWQQKVAQFNLEAVRRQMENNEP